MTTPRLRDRLVRDRLFRRSAPEDPPPEDRPPPPGDTPADPAEEAQSPYAGYERLDVTEVIHELSDHSQVELEAVESYERSHKSREAVLDKLRYLRGPEPLPRYDALESEEILATLKEADVATIKKVRGYERKFRNRPAVLDEVGRLHHQRLAAEPAPAAPGYQPLGGATAS